MSRCLGFTGDLSLGSSLLAPDFPNRTNATFLYFSVPIYIYIHVCIYIYVCMYIPSHSVPSGYWKFYRGRSLDRASARARRSGVLGPGRFEQCWKLTTSGEPPKTYLVHPCKIAGMTMHVAVHVWIYMGFWFTWYRHTWGASF